MVNVNWDIKHINTARACVLHGANVCVPFNTKPNKSHFIS